MNKASPILAVLLAAALAGCNNNLGSLDFPGVYKISITQGNVILQDMVDQLRPGMTRNQVIFVMGTPLVRDPFHQDRWDYVYNFQPGGGARTQERITIWFLDEELARVTGDFTPNPPEPLDPAPAEPEPTAAAAN